MGLSKEELLTKLESISLLHKKALAIKSKMDNFEPEDCYERKVKVPDFPSEHNNGYDCEYNQQVREVLENIDHTPNDAIDFMAECYDKAYEPRKPAPPPKPDFKEPNTWESENSQKNLGCLSYLALGVCIFFILGALFGTSGSSETIPTLLIIAVVAAVAFIVLKMRIKAIKENIAKEKLKAKDAYLEKISKLDERYGDLLKEYENKCEDYKQVRQNFLDKYTAWREVYLTSVAEENEIAEKLEAERQATVDKIRKEELEPAVFELTELNDLVTNEYLPALDIIIDLLRSGRADDLKEAINLYEDIVYKERQLQLEREKEEQRQYEEQLRREDEERRHREDMEFRQQQEYNRQEEERSRLEAEERHHKEAMDLQKQQERDRRYEEDKLRQEQQRREERAESERKSQEHKATQMQCNTCARSGRCSMAFRRPNCASYIPR